MSDKKQQRLEQLLESFDQGAVQPSDLAEVTKGILDVVKNIKEQLEAKISNTSGKADGDIASTLRSIEAKERTLNELINTKGDSVLSKVLEIQSELKKDIQTVRDLIPTIPELPDLEPLERKINALELKLPEIITREPMAVRDALELLPEGEKLAIDAIENLRKELDELKKQYAKGFVGGGGGISAVHAPLHEEFTMDGIATTVTLSQGVGAAGKAIFALRYQGQVLDMTTHYTVSGNVITFVGFTPDSGTIISITYLS